MLFGQIERELVDREPWFLWQQTKLPHHLQRLVNQEEAKHDIPKRELWRLDYSHMRLNKTVNSHQ